MERNCERNETNVGEGKRTSGRDRRSEGRSSWRGAGGNQVFATSYLEEGVGRVCSKLGLVVIAQHNYRSFPIPCY